MNGTLMQMISCLLQYGTRGLPESMTRQKQKDAVLIDEPKTKRSRVEINNEEVLLHNSNETSSDLENELEYIYFGESSDDNDSSDSDYSDYV